MATQTTSVFNPAQFAQEQTSESIPAEDLTNQNSEQNQEVVLYNTTGNSSRDLVRKMFWEIFENTPDEVVGNSSFHTNIQIVQLIEEKLFEVSQGDPRSRSYRDKSRQLQLKLKGPRFDLPRKQIKRGEITLDEICSDAYLNSKAPTATPFSGQSAALTQMAGRGRGVMNPVMPNRGRGGPGFIGQAGRGGPPIPGASRTIPFNQSVQSIPIIKQPLEASIPQIQNEDNSLQIEQQKIVEQPNQQEEKPLETEIQDNLEKQVIQNEIKQNEQNIEEKIKDPLIQIKQSEEIQNKELESTKINEIVQEDKQNQHQINLPPPRLPPQHMPMRGRGVPPPMRGGQGIIRVNPTRPPILIARPQVTQQPFNTKEQKYEKNTIDQSTQEIKPLTPKLEENSVELSKVELEFPNQSSILENNEQDLFDKKEDSIQNDEPILNFDEVKEETEINQRTDQNSEKSPDHNMDATSLVASSTDLKPGAVQNKLPLFGASLDDTMMSENSDSPHGAKKKKVKKIKKKKKLINEINELDNLITEHSQNLNEEDEEDEGLKRYDMPLQMVKKAQKNDDMPQQNKNLKFKLQNQLKDHSNQDNNQLIDQTILSPKIQTPQISATELVQQVQVQLEKISVAQENRQKIKDNVKLIDEISQGKQKSLSQFGNQENDELKKIQDLLLSKREIISNINLKCVQLESDQAIKDKKLTLFQEENLKLKREIAEYRREAEEAREELYERNSQVSNQNNQLKRALREREDALSKLQIELQHIRSERDMYHIKSQQLFRDSQIQRDKFNRLIANQNTNNLSQQLPNGLNFQGGAQGNGGMFNDNFYSQFDLQQMQIAKPEGAENRSIQVQSQNEVMSSLQNQSSNVASNNTHVINSASNNQEMNLQKELIEMRHRYEQILKEQQQELESRTRDLEKVERMNNKFRENQRILTNAVQSLDDRSNQVMAGGGSGSQTADNQFINFEQIIQNMDEEFIEIAEDSGAGGSANIESSRNVLLGTIRPSQTTTLHQQLHQNQYEMGSTLIDSAEFINSNQNPPEDTTGGEEQKLQNRSGRNSITSSQQSLPGQRKTQLQIQEKQVNPPNNQSINQINATNFKNSTHQQQYDASA